MAQHNAFWFDEQSSWDHNLVIERKSVLGFPSPDITEYQVPGRDGRVFTFDGGYSNVDVTYETVLRFPSPSDSDRYVGDLRNWLLRDPGQYFRLEDTYDYDHYRKAAVVAAPTIESSWPRVARVDIKFSCHPYRWLKSGLNRLVAKDFELTLHNPSGYTAKPEIIVYLGESFSGKDITLSSFGEDTVIRGVPAELAGQSIVVNSEDQVVYAQGYEYGTLDAVEIEYYPSLISGDNPLKISGSGLSGFAVVPHWWEL